MTAAGQEMLAQLDHSSQQARQKLLNGISAGDLRLFTAYCLASNITR